MRKFKFKRHLISCLALALVFCLPLTALAAEAPCEAATATGHYRHPVTGIIEDSGGESSFALGQSMVDSVASPDALLETGADGQLYLDLRFNLMSNISQVDFAVQQPNDAQWTPLGYESIAKGDDTEDLRFAIPGKDAILRCQLFVDARGRSVVFYVTVGDFTEGNPGNFPRMEENYTPTFTKPGEAPKPPADQGSTAVTIPQGAVTNVGMDGEVLGLVTGGTGKDNTPAETAAPGAPRDVIISGSVWVMFFVLVFCAQLLACFVFQGLRKLGTRNKKARAIPQADAVNFDDSDDADPEGSGWMEFDDENL